MSKSLFSGYLIHEMYDILIIFLAYINYIYREQSSKEWIFHLNIKKT